MKQAVVSRDGNEGLKAFATLGKKKEDALWNAIVKNDCDAFWGVASSLLSPGMKSVIFTPPLPFRVLSSSTVQVVIRVVQPSTGTLRQASAPVFDAVTKAPVTLAASLQNLFQFSLPDDSVQVKPGSQRAAFVFMSNPSRRLRRRLQFAVVCQ